MGQLGEVSNDADSLWQPILCDALNKISFEDVAQALLIQAGKWNPDTDLPEAS
jgi:hypothetical protein